MSKSGPRKLTDPDTDEEERLIARERNRNVFLTILAEEETDNPLVGPAEQYAAQLRLRTAIAYAKSIFNGAYEDEEPADREVGGRRWREYLEMYRECCEERMNFVAARRVVARAVRELDVEQKYDLYRLLDLDLLPIREPDLFEVSESVYFQKLKAISARMN